MSVTDGPYLKHQRYTSDGQGRRQIIEQWIMTCDARDDIAAARAALPNRGSAHDGDGTLFLGPVEGGQDEEDPYHYEFTLTYASTALPDTETDDDPALRPPTIVFDSIQFTEETHVNGDGTTPIKNSADQPVSLNADRHYRRMTVSALFSTHDDDSYIGYFNTYNDAEFYGYDAETVRFIDLRAERVMENGAWYWLKTFEFYVKEDGWKFTKFIDKGFVEVNDAGDDIVNIKDENDDPIVEESYLDGSGKRLSLGGSVVLRDAELYTSADYSLLGIGTTAPP